MNLSDHDLDDLKLVFRVLHAGILEHPGIIDSPFMSELQEYLHRQARADGVDTTDHGQWDEWLNNGERTVCRRAPR